MKYYLKHSALKDLKRLSKVDQKRIIRKLDFYINSPDPIKFAEPIKDTTLGEYRFRIGDYRVICDILNNTIVVLAIGHRKEIYR